MKLQLLIVVLAVALLAACATRPQGEEPSVAASLTVVNARVQYLGPDRSVLPGSHFPKDVVIILPYLSGAIFGNPRSKPIFQKRLTGELEFSLVLSDALAEMQAGAATLTREWASRGLSVTPEDTRLARIGTFAFNARTREELGYGGFIDTTTLDNLILVYVDRACEISGSFKLGEESYRHAIRLPAAGFHWLRVKRLDDDVHELIYTPPGGPVNFSIHLLDLQNA